MDSLTEMHLVLRDAGWVPEHIPAHYPEDNWQWTLAGSPIDIWTSKDSEDHVEWCECAKGSDRVIQRHDTVDELRRRLKELAAKK
jgi:hypothetical protein